MKRGQLDRNAWGFAEAALRLLRDAVERAPIGVGVALRVLVGLRRFAQHVEAVAQALRPLRSRALQRLVDRAPEDEIAAEDLHRLAHSRANHRLTEASD